MSEPRRPSGWHAVAAAAVTVAVFTPFAPLGVDTHHDGLMLKTALDVHAGQRLFRDTFTQYGPLTTYVHAAAMAVWGPRLLALKLVTVAAYAASAAALVLVWGRLLPVALVAAAFVTWLVLAPFYSVVWIMHPWASVIALACQAWSLHAFVRALESSSPRRWAAIAGIWAACALWARTPVGVCHTAALVVMWLWVGATGRRTVAVAGLGATLAATLAVHGLALAALVATGTVDAWVEQTILGPTAWAATKSHDAASILAALLPGTSSLMRLDGFAYWRTARSVPGAAVAFAVALLLPLAVRHRVGMVVTAGAAMACAFVLDPFLVATGQGLAVAVPLGMLGLVAWGALRAARGGLSPEVGLAVALGVAALASWTQYVPTNDPRHVYWAIAPALGPFVYVVFMLAGRRVGPALGVLLVLVLPVAALKADAARAKLGADLVPVPGVPVLDGMRATPSEAADLTRDAAAIAAYATRYPRAPIVVVGANALVATMAPDLRNPQPYFVQLAASPRMAMSKDALERFARELHALVRLETRNDAEVRRVAAELGYVEIARDRDGVLLGAP